MFQWIFIDIQIFSSKTMHLKMEKIVRHYSDLYTVTEMLLFS